MSLTLESQSINNLLIGRLCPNFTIDVCVNLHTKHDGKEIAEHLYANRLLLSSVSALFRDMLCVPNSDSQVSQIDVDLTHINNGAAAFKAILNFLYTGKMLVEDAQLHEILAVARACQIPNAESQVYATILESNPLTSVLLAQQQTCASVSQQSIFGSMSSPAVTTAYLEALVQLYARHNAAALSLNISNAATLPAAPAVTHTLAGNLMQQLVASTNASSWASSNLLCTQPRLNAHQAIDSEQVVHPTEIQQEVHSTAASTPVEPTVTRTVSPERRSSGSSPRSSTPSDPGTDFILPSHEKEGWCRNKKYIEKVEKGFMCTVCRKIYGRYNSVSYHVTIYHRNPPIRCEQPGCAFTTREARYIHFHKYYRHHIPLPENIDLGSRKCPLCRHVSKSPAMLHKHIARHLPGDRASVPSSPATTTVTSSPTGSSPTQAFPPPMSGFPQTTAKSNNTQGLHSGVQVPAPVNPSFRMLSSSNIDLNEFSCQQCDFSSASLIALAQHLSTSHSPLAFETPLRCTMCAFETGSTNQLIAHIGSKHPSAIAHQNATQVAAPEIQID